MITVLDTKRQIKCSIGKAIKAGQGPHPFSFLKKSEGFCVYRVKEAISLVYVKTDYQAQLYLVFLLHLLGIISAQMIRASMAHKTLTDHKGKLEEHSILLNFATWTAYLIAYLTLFLYTKTEKWPFCISTVKNETNKIP